jgi:BirA family biotin operon repressor/biotin-[acetyl-CoA-carboxylase] ligase
VSDCNRIDVARIRRSAFVADVESHELLASTNDRAIELSCSETLATPLLIVATEQSAGRGRGLNRWWSETGGLACSLVIDPSRDLISRSSSPLEPERWPRVALAAAVALCDVLQDLLPARDVALKWPNDILLNGKKLAGFLVEIPPAVPAVPRRLVLGMGVNVNNFLKHAPAEIQSMATSLVDAAGRTFEMTAFLAAWLEQFESRLLALAGDDPRLPERWQSLCALTGRTVELQSGNRQVRGLCSGIADDGALLIDSGNGPERLYAGALVRIV